MGTVNSPGFSGVLRYVEQQTGIAVPETNFRMLRETIEQRSVLLGLTVEEYIERIGKTPEEREIFLDSITINETYFFREERQFRVLANEVFPALAGRKSTDVRLWSAACSTGEEALSLGALARRVWSPESFLVFATDINPTSLACFARREYGNNSFREDGRRFHGLLEPFLERQNGRTIISAMLCSNIKVAEVNLASESYIGVPDQFDLVFLRNVLVYMRPQVRQEIIGRIVSRVAPDGWLFLSSGEIPHLSHPDLLLTESDGVFYFRKKKIEEKMVGVVPVRSIIEEQSVHDDGKAAADQAASGHPPHRRIDQRMILEQATRKLNNPLYEQEDDPAYLAAVEYLKAVFYVNEEECEKAEATLDYCEAASGKSAACAYLRGMCRLQRDTPGEALRFFEESLHRDDRFWPARFRRALILKENNPDAAVRDFALCHRQIANYIRMGLFTYQCLLEGFNAGYFDRMCEGWLHRLDADGARHAT